MPGSTTSSQCDLVPLPVAGLRASLSLRDDGLRLGLLDRLGLRAMKPGAKCVPEHHQGAK